jgi:Ca2+/H+ antiporter, TMEM165/GDT1 family
VVESLPDPWKAASEIFGGRLRMNLEKVIFGFFIILALTLNFSFVYGEIEDPAHHNFIEFFLVVVVNIIATTLKLGDRTQIGAVLLATSLVADLQLIAAAAIWTYAVHISGAGLQTESLALIVSHATGALIANIVSVTVFVAETLMLRR